MPKYYHVISILCFNMTTLAFVVETRNLEGGTRSLFDHCVMIWVWRPFWRSCMEGELLYLRFGTTIQCKSAQIIVAVCLLHNNVNECDLSPHEKDNTAERIAWRAYTWKTTVLGYNISSSKHDDKMATAADFHFNFLGLIYTVSCAEVWTHKASKTRLSFM